MYRKGHRYSIRQVRKAGITCEMAGAERLNSFAECYYQTMRRVDAAGNYFFDPGYFGRFFGMMGDAVRLFVCRDGECVICGGLFTICQGIVQYHLSGVRDGRVHLAPTTLLLDTVREWACGMGCRVFHLGGGLAGRRDSLFEFKRGFASHEHPFSVWKHVANREAYERLCAALSPPEHPAAAGFFPLYRHPRLVIGSGSQRDAREPKPALKVL